MTLAPACRIAALLAFACGALLAASQAQAYSRAIHFSHSFNLGVQNAHESKTRLRIEGKDNAGALVGTRYCGVNQNCFSTVPGAVNNVVVLEIDLGREEVLSEKCKGVVSTVPQLRCENGDLEVNLRVRYGELVIRTRGDTLLGSPANGERVRFEFAEDAAKYWNLGTFWFDPQAQAHRFPAGGYKVFAPKLVNHCQPTQLNSGVAFDLPAGGRTTVDIVYGATQCTVTIATDVDIAGLTMTSDRGALTCQARGQPGVASTKSVCTGVFPFNQQLTVSATVPVGLEPHFAWVSNTCERTADSTRCRFKPTFDSSLDIFTNIRMTTKAVGVAPPPLPVGLAFANSTSSPAQGNAAKGEAGVPMLQLTATAQNGTAMLQALTVKASGTGRDELDLMLLKVVDDANGNGVFDAGERVLAQGRPVADNGELRLAFGSPVAITDTVNLLVVADFGNEVHSASAAAVGGLTLALAMGLFALPGPRRRLAAAQRRSITPKLLAIAVTGLLLAACGGAGNPEPPAPAVADAPIDVPPPVLPPPPVPPPPVLLTYRLDLIAVEAVDTATPAAALTVRALPVVGTTITVQQ